MATMPAVVRRSGGRLQTAGFDVSPGIVGMIQKGDLDFTMDQQGWWRGYISVLELVHYIRYGLRDCARLSASPGACQRIG